MATRVIKEISGKFSWATLAPSLRKAQAREAIASRMALAPFWDCLATRLTINVIPGWCVSTRPGISRFRVRCFASPRNDDPNKEDPPHAIPQPRPQRPEDFADLPRHHDVRRADRRGDVDADRGAGTRGRRQLHR